MLIFTPADLPKIEPDNWDVFWDIWTRENKNLIKVKKNTDISGTPIGTVGAWKGFDIYKKTNYPLSWEAPFVDIKEALPKMYEAVLSVSDFIYCARLVQSQDSFAPHTDNDVDRWSLRAFLHTTSTEPQWYFTKPFDTEGERTYIKMPLDSNWFMYNDKYCWHGTDFDINHKKILLQIFCPQCPKINKLLLNSVEKYKNYTIEY